MRSLPTMQSMAREDVAAAITTEVLTPEQTDDAQSDGIPPRDDQPGALRGGVTLTLQTRQAHRLVKGRAATAETPAIIGLLGFASLLRPIWHGARADDPYADWWLIKVHQTLELAHQGLDTACERLTQRTRDNDAIAVDGAMSTKPIRVALQFSNPYAFRGARVVARYDDLARMALTARHVGLMTGRDAEELLHHGGRLARRAFLGPVGYRLTGVTRADVTWQNETALRAREAMGEVPADVQSRASRAPYAPDPSPLVNVADRLALQSLSGEHR